MSLPKVNIDPFIYFFVLIIAVSIINRPICNALLYSCNSPSFFGNDAAANQWGLPSASDPRAKNTGQRATKGTVLTSQSLSPWCDCRRLGSTLASWRWQDINVGNPL